MRNQSIRELTLGHPEPVYSKSSISTIFISNAISPHAIDSFRLVPLYCRRGSREGRIEELIWLMTIFRCDALETSFKVP